MQSASPRLDHWPSVVAHISACVDLDASARQHKALRRRRGVRSAADLLHLALLYGPGGLSLRGVAGFAEEAGIASLCDVSLLARLRGASGFLADVLNKLLADGRGEAPADGRLTLALVDGSTVSAPGAKGSDWRLHARYEPAKGRFTDLSATPAATAEALACTAVRPGDVLVQDRGYACVRNFCHARAGGADFLTRIGWRSVALCDASGGAFDLLGALSDHGPEVTERAVRIGSGRAALPARLVIARKPAQALEQERRRLARKASKKGQRTDPRTLRAAGFMMLLTSLTAEQASAEEVVRLYRMRWQIELAFKRLKSLGGFDALRALDPDLAQSWLLAHLIAAVLIEASASEGLDSPPLSRTIPRIPSRPARRACGERGSSRTGACSRRCSRCRAAARHGPTGTARGAGAKSRHASGAARRGWHRPR